MKLRSTLLAAAVATLLWTACAEPAGAAVGGPAVRPPATNLLGGSCAPSLSFTQTGGAAVSAQASIYCYSSIDYIQADIQLRRAGGVVASNTCGTTNWSVSCDTGVACQPGSYQATAQFQAYSTAGNGDYESYATPVYFITC
jgi:hypothetical protein